MACIKIKDLTYAYPKSKTPSLKNIDLEIEEGQFVLILGGSGSGKSTLLRAIAGLIPGFYGGTLKGSVQIDNMEINQLSRREIVQKIGILFQDPENQIVMTDVEHELTFGLENIGIPLNIMKRRVMEISESLDLFPILNNGIEELSGGQKQKVAFGSVLAMQPEILLLDEPTSQLDPVSGEDTIALAKRLNEDNGLTVVLVEQRLERCFHIADRVIIIENGSIIFDCTDKNQMAKWAVQKNVSYIPPVSQLFVESGYEKIPFTVKDGRNLLKSIYDDSDEKDPFVKPKLGNEINREVLVSIEKAAYHLKNGEPILENISMEVRSEDFTVIMGENGAGKSTLLKLINGLYKPTTGQINVMNQDTRKVTVEDLACDVGYLSQNPNDYLFSQTVKEEILFTLKNRGLKDDGEVNRLLEKLEIADYANGNPRDLSTGERQRVALASILALGPKLLLLDEPTRGLDYQLKNRLGILLQELQKEGTGIVVVTHDVEFAAEYAKTVILLSRGKVIDSGEKHKMFTQSTFYSSQISKLFCGIDESIVTLKEANKALQLKSKRFALREVSK